MHVFEILCCNNIQDQSESVYLSETCCLCTFTMSSRGAEVGFRCGGAKGRSEQVRNRCMSHGAINLCYSL